MTIIPELANAIVIFAPMPPLAPVTKATFPIHLFIFSEFCLHWFLRLSCVRLCVIALVLPLCFSLSIAENELDGDENELLDDDDNYGNTDDNMMHLANTTIQTMVEVGSTSNRAEARENYNVEIF